MRSFLLRHLGLPILAAATLVAFGCGGSEPSHEGSSSGGSSATGSNGGAGPEAGAGGGSAGGAGGAGVGGGGDAEPTCARTIPVSTSDAMNTAIADAKPGDCIVLADGHYTFNTIGAQGTAESPIVIRAENRGKAEVSSGGLTMADAAYVTVEGLLWTSSSGVSIADCDHCRVSRCDFHIKETGPISWIVVKGSKGGHNRIDHNALGPKTHQGNMIGIYGGSTIIEHTRIDHNHFHDIGPVTSNGWETIRGGLSGLAKSSGYIVIEDNLFENCQGDPEMISLKSCDNTVRYNTVRKSKGEITLRIGSRNSVYGNYLLGEGVDGTGGIRVCGQDHRIYNNYIEGVSENGIFLEGGESEETPTADKWHYRVYRAQVLFNTLVGNQGGIQIGGSHPLSPVDSMIANNIVQGDSGSMILEVSSPVNTTYLGNIVNPSGSASVGVKTSSAGVQKVDPLLTRVGEALKLSSMSPAIDAATGSFSFVTDDIEGDARVKPDVGADERSSAAPKRGPLTAVDVGPDAP
jgi:hypothetical protein